MSMKSAFTHGEGFQVEKLGRGIFFKIFEEYTPLISTHSLIPLCMNVFVHVCVHMCVCLSVCLHVCMYICISLGNSLIIYQQTWGNTLTKICLYLYLSLFLTCMYIYIHTQLYTKYIDIHIV